MYSRIQSNFLECLSWCNMIVMMSKLWNASIMQEEWQLFRLLVKWISHKHTGFPCKFKHTKPARDHDNDAHTSRIYLRGLYMA